MKPSKPSSLTVYSRNQRPVTVLALIGVLIGVLALLVALCALHPPDPASVSIDTSRKGGSQSYAYQLSVALTNNTSTDMRGVNVSIEPNDGDQELRYETAIATPRLKSGQVNAEIEATGQLRTTIDGLKIGQEVVLQASARLLPGGVLKVEAIGHPTLEGSFQCLVPADNSAIECPLKFPGTRLGICNFLYRITKPILGG